MNTHLNLNENYGNLKALHLEVKSNSTREQNPSTLGDAYYSEIVSLSIYIILLIVAKFIKSKFFKNNEKSNRENP